MTGTKGDAKQSLIFQQDFQQVEPNEDIKYSESFSLFLFSMAVTCYGISNFHLKYITYLFKTEYNLFSFILWRNLSLTLIIYGIIRYRKIDIIDITKINSKFWLGVRTIGQYCSLMFFMKSMESLRVGTANCFVSMNPAGVVIISSLLLKEKFHIRYAIGIFTCFMGVLLIISNEGGDPIEGETKGSIFTGVVFGTMNLITIAMLTVSSKFLHKDNFGHENQCFYIGLSNLLFSIPLIIMNGNFNYSFSFIIASALNSVIFLAATFMTILSVKGVDLSKTTPLNYISIIVSTFLSIIFLNEPLYFTDILGSLVILGYNIFNSLNPIE